MTFHKKKQDILEFLEKLNEMLGRYHKYHGHYPPSIPFLIYLHKTPVTPALYVNRPDDIFTHITLASWVPQKAIYPKISSMDWWYIQSISLENLIAPTIDPGAIYQIAPDMPRGADINQYYVPLFIVEDYCQDKWYYPDW